MDLLQHLLFFLLAASAIWIFSGLLVGSVDRVAKRFHQSGFTVAFFVLGFMTSISEISVMVNSTLNGTPQVSAGNLVGASFIILLLIVPFLAIIGNGISLKNSFTKWQFALALIVIALPALCLSDGKVSPGEGLICLLGYSILLYFIHKSKPETIPEVIEEVEKELTHKKHATLYDLLTIVGGAIAIFVSGHVLVEETVYFSGMFGIPSSIIGLVVLAIGTNVPELVIAVRSIKSGHADIAFGDYMGSTVANTVVFAVLSLLNGAFTVEASEFAVAIILIIISFTALFVFAQSQNRLSRREGIILISIYAIFILIQVINVVRFATV